MNFKQLEYVIAIEEHKQFSEAAFSCDVTQATLSAMVIRLEEELGFTIFDRTTKPVTTTDQGKEVVRKAKEILSLKNQMTQIGSVIPDSISGKFTIGVIPTVANSLLSKVLPELLNANPNLKLEVKEITTEEVIRNLKLGIIDFGIAATPLQEENIDEEIMYYEPMLVYGVEENRKEYLITKDLLNDKVWLLEEGHCFREQVSTVCSVRERKDAASQFNFEGNSFETLLSMVDSFGGFTLIPELYYLDMNESQRAKCKMFKKPIPVREICILSYGPSKRDLTSQYLARFIRKIILPALSTNEFENKNLRIVGIH